MYLTVILVVLIVAGSLMAGWASIDAYRGRMREQPKGSGLYTPPKDSRLGVSLGLVGAAVALVSGLLGVLL